MPLPEPREYENYEQLDSDYFARGWSREISFPYVSFNQRLGSYFVTNYVVDADKMYQCVNNHPVRMWYVQLSPHGLIFVCAGCRQAMGMISLDSPPVTEIDRKPITRKEALEIVKTTKQKVIGLQPDERFNHVKKLMELDE